MSIYKQLLEIGALLKLDCGDNSCYFAPAKGGMRTNGVCGCDAAAEVRALQEELDREITVGARLVDQQNELLEELAETKGRYIAELKVFQEQLDLLKRVDDVLLRHKK